jgi:radical SAM protein with 4Fe4S-binding SPASM domain
MAGIEGIGIESNGNIKGCLSIRSEKAIEGNIRTTPLKEIWENTNNFKYTRNFHASDLGERCKSCEYGTRCKGGCSSQSTAFFNEFNNAPYCFLRYEKKYKT